MHCKEVKRLIDRGLLELDPAAAEHLRRCPSCARAMEAAEILDSVFKAAKSDEPVESFTALRERMRTAAASRTIKERIMEQIKDQYHARPKLIAGIGLAAAAIMIFCLVPFTYTHTSGYKVSIPGLDPEAAISPDLVSAAMSTIGYRDVAVSVTPRGALRDYTLSNLPSEREAREVGEAFALLAGRKRKPRVDPIRISVSAPMLAWVSEKVKPEEEEPAKVAVREGTIFINAKDVIKLIASPDLSDEEVKAELEKIISGNRKDSLEAKVSVETDPVKGDRVVKIEVFTEMGGNPDAKPLLFSLTKDDIHMDYQGHLLIMNREDPENIKVYEETEKGRRVLLRIDTRSKDD